MLQPQKLNSLATLNTRSAQLLPQISSSSTSSKNSSIGSKSSSKLVESETLSGTDTHKTNPRKAKPQKVDSRLNHIRQGNDKETNAQISNNSTSKIPTTNNKVSQYQQKNAGK